MVSTAVSTAGVQQCSSRVVEHWSIAVTGWQSIRAVEQQCSRATVVVELAE